MDPLIDTNIGGDSVMTYNTRREDSSLGFTSDPEFRRDSQSSVSVPVPPIGDREGHLDQGFSTMSLECSNPGAETLGALRQEAVREKGKSRRQSQIQTKAKRPSRPRRRIGRIMRVEYFDSTP